MWRRTSLLQGSQTPEEAAQDPYSPTFGQYVYDVNAIEPGLDLSSPLGRFRNDRTFKQARINLLKAYEASNKIKGQLDPDRNFRSIAMMGPAFMAFFVAARAVENALYTKMDFERELAGLPPMPDSEWHDLQKTFYKKESEVMRDWLVVHTGEDPTSITDMLAGLYAAAGTADWVKVGTEFGREMAIRSRQNQLLREQQRVLDERTARDQARERSMFWRKWRMDKLEKERKEAEAAEAEAQSQVAGGAPGQVGTSSAMDELGGLGMGQPSMTPASSSAMEELGGLGEAPPPPAPSRSRAQSTGGVQKITSFRGPHFFLSNMYDVPIVVEGVTYPRVENAFHAMKTNIPAERAKFLNVDGKTAKRLGRGVTLAGGAMWWNEHRVPVMLELLRQKFLHHPELRQQLLATGDAHLEEGYPARDVFWGVVDGKGQNMLGKLLMQVRDELRTRSNGRRRF